MASQTIVHLVDDLDGSAAEETVEFGLDGSQYEIDLSDANAAILRERLEAFVKVARKVGRTRSARPARKSAGNGDNKALREWASSQGYDIGSRGRVPADVRNAYLAAHGG